MEDDVIRAMLTRLSRRNSSGGVVVERAAILAEGADLDAVVQWIVAHDGEPEAAAPAKTRGGGLHGVRLSTTSQDAGRAPRRYVLPASVLAEPARTPEPADTPS